MIGLISCFRISLSIITISTVFGFYHTSTIKIHQQHLLLISSSPTVLNAQKWFRTTLNPFSLRKTVQNPILESSVGTVLLLTNKRRQQDFKKDMQQKYPLIPSKAIDVCLDAFAESFAKYVPDQLKKSLTPGGLTKARPVLEENIVKSLQEKNSLKTLLPSATLRQLVSFALDYVLKDVEEILADPNHSLRALEAQSLQITRYMSRRQLLWYEIQYHPLRMLLVVSASCWICFSLYLQYQHLVIVGWIVDSSKRAISVILPAFTTLVSLIKILMAKCAVLVSNMNANLIENKKA